MKYLVCKLEADTASFGCEENYLSGKLRKEGSHPSLRLSQLVGMIRNAMDLDRSYIPILGRCLALTVKTAKVSPINKRFSTKLYAVEGKQNFLRRGERKGKGAKNYIGEKLHYDFVESFCAISVKEFGLDLSLEEIGLKLEKPEYLIWAGRKGGSTVIESARIVEADTVAEAFSQYGTPVCELTITDEHHLEVRVGEDIPLKEVRDIPLSPRLYGLRKVCIEKVKVPYASNYSKVVKPYEFNFPLPSNTADANLIHKEVCRLFPMNGRPQVLWRIEGDTIHCRTTSRLLPTSKAKVSFANSDYFSVMSQFNVLLYPGTTRGGKKRSLIDEAIKSKLDPDRVVSDWLESRLGCKVRGVVIESAKVCNNRGFFRPHKVTVQVGSISDTNKFEEVFLKGIGRKLAYGCGMMYL